MGKRLIVILTALLFNCVAGAALGSAVGIDPLLGAVGMNGLAALPGLMPAGGVMSATVCKEIWTGEMVKALRGFMDGSWLDGIPDMSSLVNNDVIHLVDVGIDPEVLTNNTTYPIAVQSLTDSDISISLDKFQTKPTPITDDELYAISYDKMARVKESHANAISDARLKKAAHSICPAENAAKTPVIETSGAADSTGRHKMLPEDILAMKTQMDNLKVPAEGRRLVLCPAHVADLLSADQSFREQYSLDTVNGKCGRLYGFDIYEFSATPVYGTDGKKKAVGAAEGSGAFQCSFAFYTGRIFKATGSMKMYYSPAENDPQYQRSLISFTNYFIAMPKKADAAVALRSKYTAPTTDK